jgi:CelD/BcsL family acetyltransferase involved in cellulose biosynthesis
MGAASGEAVTSGLVVDGRLVSADFGIVSGNAHYSILCASNLDEYGQYSPGLQSLFATIRHCHEQGQTRFNFGIGKTRQKSDFGSTEIPLYNLTVARSTSGQVVSLIYNRAKPLKTFLRRMTRWIR